MRVHRSSYGAMGRGFCALFGVEPTAQAVAAGSRLGLFIEQQIAIVEAQAKKE